MNPQLLIDLYQSRPDYFTEEEVDNLEKLANQSGLDFARNPVDEDFKLGRTIGKAVEGVVDGMTTISVGDDPRNFPERMAKGIGHLVGFVGGPTKFLAAAKIGKGIKGLDTIAKAGGSVPMIGANVLFKGAGKIAKQSTALKSIKWLKEGTKSADIIHDALHLGTASAISSWTHGIDEMMASFMHGSMAGGVFAGIGNYAKLQGMVNSTNPTVAKYGAQGVRALAGGMANHLMTVIPQEDVPAEDQIYSFLLGTYFGYKTMPAHKKMAARKYAETREKNLEKVEDLEGFKDFPKQVREELVREQEIQNAVKTLAAQEFMEEPPVVQYKGDQYSVVGEPTAKGRIPILDINDPNAKIKYVKPDNIETQLGLDITKHVETRPTEKPMETAEVENPESVHTVVDLSTRLLNVTKSISNRGGQNKDEVAKILDGEIKNVRAIEDADVFIENVRKRLPEGRNKKGEKIENIPEGSAEYQDLRSFHKRITTEERVFEIAFDLNNGVFIRGDINNKNELIIKNKAPSFFDRITNGFKSILEKVDMIWEGDGGKRGIWTSNISRYLDYRSIPSKADKTSEGRKLRKKMGKRYYMLHKDLAENGLYIHSGVKEKGRFVAIPFSVQGKEATVFVNKEMLQMNKHFKGSNKQYKANRKRFQDEMVEFKQMSKEKAGELYDSIVGSNIQMLQKINGLKYQDMVKAVREDINAGRKPRFILNAQELTQRMQVLDAGEPGLNPKVYEKIADIKDGFNLSIISSKGKEIDGRINHLDGVFVIRQDVFDAMVKDGGYPIDSGVLKGTLTTNATGKGVIVGKFAYFRADSDQNKEMVHHKLHGKMYDTANKQAGFHESMEMRVDDNLTTTYRTIDPLTGKKGKMVGRFNELNKKNQEGQLTSYRIPLEDIRLNLSNYENPKKLLEDTFVVRQIFTSQVEEQIPRGVIKEFVSKHMESSVNGRPEMNKAIEDFMAGKRKVKDVESLNLEDISLQNIIKIVSGPDSPLYRKVWSELLKVERNSDWLNDGLVTPEMLKEVESIRSFNSVADRIFKAWEHTPITMNFPHASRMSEMILRKYTLNRILRPKIEGSFKAIGNPYSEYLQKKYKIGYGEYMLHEGAGAKLVEFNGKKITLRMLWDQHGKTNPELFEHVVARVPIDSISGIRALKFKGFTKERGTGAILNPKDMEYLGGMDLDIDSVFIYTKTSKEFRKALKKNKDEHEVKGKTQEAISERAKAKWTVASDPEKAIMSGLDPYARIDQSVTFERSARDIGAAVHAKNRVNTLYTMFNMQKGAKLPIDAEILRGIINDKGAFKGEDTLYVKLIPSKDNGRLLREDARALMNIVLDAPKFKGIIPTSAEFQTELLKVAFKEIQVLNGKGRKVYSTEFGIPDAMKLLRGTIYNEMMKVNDAFRGYGYGREAGESVKKGFNVWSPDNENIINIARRLVDRAEAEGLDIPGATIVQARKLAELEADFSVASWIDPAKVQNMISDFARLTKTGNKKLAKILKKEYTKGADLNKLPETTTKEIRAKRDFIIDRITTLVSVKRLMEASKGLNDAQITSIMHEANMLRNKYAILMSQKLGEQKILKQFSSQKMTVEQINKQIMELNKSFNEKERAFFHEVLLSNVYRHDAKDLASLKKRLGKQIQSAKKAGNKEDQAILEYTLRNVGGIINKTKHLSIGIGSEAIPNKTISAWGKDFNSITRQVGDKGNTLTIKQILGLEKPTTTATKELSEFESNISGKEDKKFIHEMTKAYFKELPDSPRIQKAREDLARIKKMFPEMDIKKFDQIFAGVLDQKFFAMNLPGISKSVTASKLTDLEFFNKSMLSIKEGNWVDRMLKLKKADKDGNLVWNKIYTYLFPDTIAEKHLYSDLQWMPKKTHVVYKDGLVTKTKDMDVLIPISHMGYQTRVQDIALQAKEFGEKAIERVYDKETRWMAKIENRRSIEDAVILLRNYRAFPDLNPNHVWHKQAKDAQKYLDGLKDKQFSIIEGSKPKYVDIEYIASKMNKTVDRIVDYVSKELYHGKNPKEFEKMFYEKTKKYWDEHGWFNYEKFITDNISHKLFNNRTSEFVGDKYTVQFMLRLSHHVKINNYLHNEKTLKKIGDLDGKQRAILVKKLMKRVPMRQIGFIEKDYFPLREHLRAEKDAYMERLALSLAEQGMSEKDIATTVLSAKNNEAFRSSEDGGYARDMADILTGSNESVNRIKRELRFKQTGQQRRPGSTLRRSKTNPIPGNDNSFEALRNYMVEGVKAKYNLAMALSSWRTINHLEVSKAMGKQTKLWGMFARLQANGALGYPSILPEAWANNPNFNIKKTLWYKFSDQAMKKRMDKISKTFFDGKEWFKDDNELYSKMAHYANLEAKWSMMTLLASTRTMANNMLGGSVHSIINAGLRPWWDAGKINNLRSRIPLAKGENAKTLRDWDYFTNFAESHGATESWLRAELKANPLFRSAKGGRFINELMENMKKNKWETDKATVMELAKRHGYSTKIMEGAGWFMKVTEARLRRRAFLAHYLNAMDVLEANKVKFDRDDPWLVRFAMEGVKGTQFIYNNANRPLFSTSNFGRIFSRFQIWTWNSIRFRKDMYKQAKAMGFNPMSKEFERYKRMVMADMFMFSLASIFPATIFENNMPAPWAQLQDLSAVMFGSERDRERAFFGTLPPEISWIQAVSPPSSRYIIQPIGNMLKGDWSKFASYQVWTWFPFGRMLRTVVGPNGLTENPMGAINSLFGLPQFQLSAIAKERRKAKQETEEE